MNISTNNVGLEYFKCVLQEGWTRFVSEEERNILCTKSFKIMQKEMKITMDCEEKAAKLLLCFSYLDQLYGMVIIGDHILLKKHVDSLLKILRHSTTACIEGLNESITSHIADGTISNVIISNYIKICQLVCQISYHLVVDVTSLPEESATFQSLPSTLISMYSLVIKHQKNSEHELANLDAKVVEELTNLYSYCAVCCDTFFQCLATIIVCTKTPPSEKCKVLSLLTSLCRQLSCTSNMKAVISGWKALQSLLLTAAAEGSDLREMSELNVCQMVEEISLDVIDGIDILYDIEKEHYKLTNKFDSNSTVVCKRVLKMSSFCVKIVMSLIDLTISSMDLHTLVKIMHFALLISKCCISVSCMETESIIGGGLTEQLQMGLQLILSATMRSTHYIEAIESCIEEWQKEIIKLEKKCLKSSIFNLSTLTDKSWRVFSGGPLLFLCYSCISVPKVMQMSPLSPNVTCTLVSCLLQWMPYCHGLFSSQMRVVAPPPEGGTGQILPLYDWCLVSVCVCVPCVPHTDEGWERLEKILFQSLFGLKPLLSNKDKENIPLTEEDSFEEVEPLSKRRRLEVTSSVNDSATATDWFWPHILSADVLSFISRLSSSTLCERQYLVLFQASVCLPLLSKLLPYLCCVMFRVMRLLENPSLTLMKHLKERKGSLQEMLILCHLSGAAIAAADSFSAECVRECQEVVSSTADHLLLIVAHCLNQKPEPSHWGQLHHHLRCVDMYLTSAKKPVAKFHRSEDICGAVAQLWKRLSVKAISCTAGEWLLSALLSVSGKLSHLMQSDTLYTVVKKMAVTKVTTVASAAATESMAVFVKSLAHITLSSDVTTALSDLFQCLVADDSNPWLSMCSSEAFIYFAQHSSHAEVISKVLKRASPEIKKRLQNFLLQNAHLPPEYSNSIEFTERENFLTAPDIIFYQQTVLNHKVKDSHKNLPVEISKSRPVFAPSQETKNLQITITDKINGARKAWQQISESKTKVSEEELKLIDSLLKTLNSSLTSVLNRI